MSDKYSNGGRYARYNRELLSKDQYDTRVKIKPSLATILLDTIVYVTGISLIVYFIVSHGGIELINQIVGLF